MTSISTLVVMRAHKIVESVYLVLPDEISQANDLVELLPKKEICFQVCTTCTFTGMFCSKQNKTNNTWLAVKVHEQSKW